MALGEVSTSSADTNGVTHQFINSTSQPVTVYWVDFSGEEQQYQTLEPGHSSPQRPSAALEALGPGKLHVRPLNFSDTPDPAWGAWRRRAEACGVPIMAYDCVGEDAVLAAVSILRHMLAGCPQEVVKRLAAAEACVGIIGQCQVTSDMPGHTHLKLSQGGRDLDATARGLGGCEGCPITTCGEENLTMVDDTRYPSENILIHEFAHTVMNLGMSEDQRERVRKLYDSAVRLGLYSPGCYALENADEYWAEGTQSWFEATVREDVNGGVNTRAKLVAHDPGLADLMQQVWGYNEWRYPDTAPYPLRSPRSGGGLHRSGSANGMVANVSVLTLVTLAHGAAHPHANAASQPPSPTQATRTPRPPRAATAMSRSACGAHWVPTPFLACTASSWLPFASCLPTTHSHRKRPSNCQSVDLVEFPCLSPRAPGDPWRSSPASASPLPLHTHQQQQPSIFTSIESFFARPWMHSAASATKSH